MLDNGLDELPPQTRRLLEQIDELVTTRAKQQGIEKRAVRFTRREIREHTKLGHTQLRVHVGRLEEMEYLLVHGGGGKRRFVYELASESTATSNYGDHLAGGTPHIAGSGRGHGGAATRQEYSSNIPEKRDLGGDLAGGLLRSPSKTSSHPKMNGAAQGV